MAESNYSLRWQKMKYSSDIDKKEKASVEKHSERL